MTTEMGTTVSRSSPPDSETNRAPFATKRGWYTGKNLMTLQSPTPSTSSNTDTDGKYSPPAIVRDEKGKFAPKKGADSDVVGSGSPTPAKDSQQISQLPMASSSAEKSPPSVLRDSNSKFAPKNGTDRDIVKSATHTPPISSQPNPRTSKRSSGFSDDDDSDYEPKVRTSGNKRASMGPSPSEKESPSLLRDSKGKFAPKQGAGGKAARAETAAPRSNSRPTSRTSMGSSTSSDRGKSARSLLRDSKGKFVPKHGAEGKVVRSAATTLRSNSRPTSRISMRFPTASDSGKSARSLLRDSKGKFASKNSLNGETGKSEPQTPPNILPPDLRASKPQVIIYQSRHNLKDAESSEAVVGPRPGDSMSQSDSEEPSARSQPIKSEVITPHLTTPQAVKSRQVIPRHGDEDEDRSGEGDITSGTVITPNPRPGHSTLRRTNVTSEIRAKLSQSPLSGVTPRPSNSDEGQGRHDPRIDDSSEESEDYESDEPEVPQATPLTTKTQHTTPRLHRSISLEIPETESEEDIVTARVRTMFNNPQPTRLSPKPNVVTPETPPRPTDLQRAHEAISPFLTMTRAHANLVRAQQERTSPGSSGDAFRSPTNRTKSPAARDSLPKPITIVSGSQVSSSRLIYGSSKINGTASPSPAYPKMPQPVRTSPNANAVFSGTPAKLNKLQPTHGSPKLNGATSTSPANLTNPQSGRSSPRPNTATSVAQPDITKSEVARVLPTKSNNLTSSIQAMQANLQAALTPPGVSALTLATRHDNSQPEQTASNPINVTVGSQANKSPPTQTASTQNDVNEGGDKLGNNDTSDEESDDSGSEGSPSKNSVSKNSDSEDSSSEECSSEESSSEESDSESDSGESDTPHVELPSSRKRSLEDSEESSQPSKRIRADASITTERHKSESQQVASQPVQAEADAENSAEEEIVTAGARASLTNPRLNPEAPRSRSIYEGTYDSNGEHDDVRGDESETESDSDSVPPDDETEEDAAGAKPRHIGFPPVEELPIWFPENIKQMYRVDRHGGALSYKELNAITRYRAALEIIYRRKWSRYIEAGKARFKLQRAIHHLKIRPLSKKFYKYRKEQFRVWKAEGLRLWKRLEKYHRGILILDETIRINFRQERIMWEKHLGGRWLLG